MKKGVTVLIIAAIVILLAVGAYFLFVNKSTNINSTGQQYLSPNVSGSQTNSSASKYSGIDLTPTSPQTDAVPSSGTNIPAP